MWSREPQRLTRTERRRGLRRGLTNGVLWASGNALTSSTLIVYLALEFGAEGRAISLILALPAFVGLVRIASPPLIESLRTARRTCLTMFVPSYLLLLGLPVLAWPTADWSSSSRLTALIALLCAHQVLEYFGTVAYWTWMGQLVPERLRGRYFGRLNVYKLAVLMPLLIASGAFTDYWRNNYADELLWGYAITSGIGAALMIVSLIPLASMPAVRYERPKGQTGFQFTAAPFLDRRYWPMLCFGVATAIANGITQSGQNIYMYAILGVGLFPLLTMQTAMRGGQIAYSRWLGPVSDRVGNRPILIVSQVVVAVALLFFVFATPEESYWIAGAWLLWSFYAGHNVCIPNLQLKLATRENYAAYVAAYRTVSTITYAVATIVGGEIWTLAKEHTFTVTIGVRPFDQFDTVFVAGAVLRLVAVIPLLFIAEPGARLVLQAFARRGGRETESA